MIIGAHTIIYSQDPDSDRAIMRDVLGFPFIDVGDGWLVFKLPPAEVAVHPSDRNDIHELYLLCDDIDAFVGEMKSKSVPSTPVEDRSWGRITYLTLPGGGRLGIYQPKHSRP